MGVFSALVLGAVCMGVDGQFPVLRCTLYSGSSGCTPNPFVMVDAMYLAFGRLAFGLSPAFNGADHFSLHVSSSGVRSSAPSRPRSAGNGRGQGRTPSQSPAWQTGSRNNPVDENVSKYIPDCTDPWTDTSSNCWLLDEHHVAEIFPVCSSIHTDDPLRSGRLTPFTLLPSEKTGAIV